MSAATATKQRRAIGIVRVSQTKGRDKPRKDGDKQTKGRAESFVSKEEQRERIRDACERDGLRLLETIEEMDVSGGTPLKQRAGLRRAVEAVEDGNAEVIVAAYFDRLVRSLQVQGDLVSRVEGAGGQVLAVDVGRVTNGSAGQWLSGTMLGAVSEYQRRTAKERSAEGQARAIARGVAPWPNVPPGYVRGEGKKLEKDPETAPAVAEAFRMRADGATIADVREYLQSQGIERSYHGVQQLLGSRVVLGEIHFGNYEPNLAAHDEIVDRDLWQRVQRVKVPRGRRPKSDRLLARLGVLRCDSCGARMVVGTQTQQGRSYPFYRCPPVGDCKRRVTISAEMVEGIVTEAVRDALADVEGRASVEENVREADLELQRAQEDFDSAIRTLAGFEDEGAARDRLLELRRARDEAQERRDQLGDQTADLTVSASADWDRLSLDARRDLIRAVVERVTVAPGRGPERITVELR